MRSMVALGGLAVGSSVLATTELEQFTPELADWSQFTLNPLFADHSPDAFNYKNESWPDWDGTVIDPSAMTKDEFYKAICPGGIHLMRGIRKLFYDNNPFADLQNPTKAEVDHWHMLGLNHLRAMVGLNTPEYVIKPDKCLHIGALWADEKQRTTKWDPPTYLEAGYSCNDGSARSKRPHCGAFFIPKAEFQQPYLEEGMEPCVQRGGAEGKFMAKNDHPWSVKWTGSLCKVLKREGYWGGHVGPWFRRSRYGWNFFPGHGLRANWGGNLESYKYVDPQIAAGVWLVNGVDPTYEQQECEGRIWKWEKIPTGTECYNLVMGDPSCGKRFVTWSGHGSKGCACYPPAMTECKVQSISGRLTWDLGPSANSANSGPSSHSSDGIMTGMPFRALTAGLTLAFSRLVAL